MIEVELDSVRRRSIKEILLVMFSGIMAAAVTLLAYVRLLEKHWAPTLEDLGFVGIMLLLFVFVYVGRKTQTVGILMALGFISAALTSTLLLGVSELFWAFPALMVAYFMLDTRQATILTGGFVCCFLAIMWDDLSAVALTNVCLTVVTTVLLAHAFSLTNRRQLEDLRRMVHVDPLTGAGNRRAQNIKLDAVNGIFRRNDSPACLLMLDIDHFKCINDTYGHTVGDQILIDLSELLRSTTRATETLYRFGGEEFVLVVEQTALDAAVNLAENLRSRIEQQLFSFGISLTVSIGVAQLQREEDREGWLKRVDDALYRAKGRGRNQVIAAGAQASSTVLRMPSVRRHDEPAVEPVILARSM